MIHQPSLTCLLQAILGCVASGATLATVSSQTEQDAVFALTGATGQSSDNLSMWALVLVLYLDCEFLPYIICSLYQGPGSD